VTSVAAGSAAAPRPDRATTFRPATPDDLPACAEVWRAALNDYMGRLNLPPIPEELAPIGRLHAHLQATDPERFWVATDVRGELDGFVSAVVRERVWFLSMLFVRPGVQGRGLGRALLARVLPAREDGMVLATCTDAAQPISNALYSTYGIVPRMPLLNLTGRPGQPAALMPLPAGIAAGPLDPVADAAAVAELDCDAVGFAHPQDHGFLASEGRHGFAYRAGGSLVAYGYASAVGRIGPVAVRDEDLLGPVLGHLLTAIAPRGASAVWVPGHADRAVVTLLDAGLRFEGFPVLACWSAPFADFRRYLPISPGLL
jgi:GNAT superfamily N-acetyltransferase